MIKTTAEERKTINQIVKRMSKYLKTHYLSMDKLSITMDIYITHLRYPLRLKALLKSDPFDFMYEIIGITNNINRKTGEFTYGYLPRYAKQQHQHN